MEFLNIHVFEDNQDNTIKIQLDMVRQDVGLSALYHEPVYEPVGSVPHNLSKFFFPHPPEYDKFLIENFHRCADKKRLFSALMPIRCLNRDLESYVPGGIMEQRVKQVQRSTTYTLSKIPYIAIYQIWSLVLHVANNNIIYLNTWLGGYNQHGMLELPAVNIENVKANLAVALTDVIILQCSKVASYEHIMEAFIKIKASYINRADGKLLMNCFDVEQRCKLFYNKLTETFLNPQIPSSKKISAFLEHARSLIREGKNDELNFQINSLHDLTLQKLIAPCIGQVSYQGVKESKNMTYSLNYTELQFLMNAHFFLRSDGRMSIIKLPSNESYIKYYAVNQRLHGMLKAELFYLGRIIGLEYDEDSNYDNEIIFTKDCSIRLQASGLHLIVNYIKGMLFAQNQFSLFARSRPKPNPALAYQPNVLSNLPLEIYVSTLDCINPFLNESELTAVLHETQTLFARKMSITDGSVGFFSSESPEFQATEDIEASASKRIKLGF